MARKTKQETVTISAHDRWMRHVWITSENGNTCRRVAKFAVFENGHELCTFDGTDVHDKLKENDKKPITLTIPIKWNTRKEPDLNADHAHMVRCNTVWDDVAYTLYIPAEYAQVTKLPPKRNGYYMINDYTSPLFGKCSHWRTFPGFNAYELHNKIEEASKEYVYTGLKIACSDGSAYVDELISAINAARDEAARIINLSDDEFFAAFDDKEA